jgi:hypothetical protein
MTPAANSANGLVERAMRRTRIVADALEIWAPVPRVLGAPTQWPVPESSLPIAVRKFQCPCMHANALLPFAMMFDVHVLCQQRPEKGSCTHKTHCINPSGQVSRDGEEKRCSGAQGIRHCIDRIGVCLGELHFVVDPLIVRM